MSLGSPAWRRSIHLVRSRVPRVLRKRDDGRSGYTLRGDAFVYGAMDGEFMNSDMKQVDV
jgi:hypothetical protein